MNIPREWQIWNNQDVEKGQIRQAIAGVDCPAGTHVIEYSAYQELKNKVDSLESQLEYEKDAKSAYLTMLEGEKMSNHKLIKRLTLQVFSACNALSNDIQVVDADELENILKEGFRRIPDEDIDYIQIILKPEDKKVSKEEIIVALLNITNKPFDANILANKIKKYGIKE